MSFLSQHALKSAPTAASWAPITRAFGGPEVTVSWVAGPGRDHRLIDVRGSDEFHGPLGHVQGSEQVPLEALPRMAVGWDREQPIVLICRSGGRSLAAAGLMEAMGFHKVASMAGGMIQWGQQGHTVER